MRETLSRGSLETHCRREGFSQRKTRRGGEGERMISVGGWEELKPLGEGGQSKVFLVRSPGRIQERRDVIQRVLGANPWEIRINEQERAERIDRLATALG